MADAAQRFVQVPSCRARRFLGWTLDAFDFLHRSFSLRYALRISCGVTKKEIVLTITATLAMRPVGALLSACLRTATAPYPAGWPT